VRSFWLLEFLATARNIFGSNAAFVKEHFLETNSRNGYDLKEPFDTQRKVAAWFDKQETSEENTQIRQGLYDLITNVLMFEEEGSDRQSFHFRILMESTVSFQHLDHNLQQKLKDLYVNYFYRRQDGFWKEEALKKVEASSSSKFKVLAGFDTGG
jgi:4-alpha-glucanotransferase